MSTRMQQRRGTAAQWISTNSGNGPILAAGEIGFESDTNKFKIGDGVNHWVDLTYFTDAESAISAISDIIDGAPAALNTLNELAAAINDDPNFFTTISTDLSTHISDSTNIHGITDTAELATKTFAAELLTNATKSNITITGDKNGLTISAENGVADSDTDDLTEGSTNKYFTDERAQDAVGNAVGNGLSYDDASGAISVDTLTIATQEYVDSAVGNAEVDQSTLAGDGISWNVGTSQFDVDTTTIQARVADVSDTEIGYLNGVTSGIQAQLDDKLDSSTAASTYAPLSGPTLTGTTTTSDLVVNGDFTVNGTNFSASATSITIEDNMVQLAHQNAANTVDLGLVVAYNDGAAKHSGLVRDVSDNKWKLFKGVTTEPSTTVDFTQGSLDDLAVGTLTGNVTGDLTGNADTATALETARNIAGHSFDGTADISIATTDLTDVTASAAELNILDGATLSTLELNILDGALISTTELNYLNGVTSAIQTQLDDKASTSYVDSAVTNAEVDQSTLAGVGISWNVGTSQFDLDTVATTLGGTGLTGYTSGDMIYASDTDTLAKLAKGTANQVMYMKADGSGPEWRTAAAGAAFSELMLIGA